MSGDITPKYCSAVENKTMMHFKRETMVLMVQESIPAKVGE